MPENTPIQPPDYSPSQDALGFAGQAALGIVPGVGQLAADALGYALQRRQDRRQHEFNTEVAKALNATFERLGDTVTLEQVFESDEFVASITRASRLASETASAAKRRRLATAVANSGSWSGFTATERSQFERLVEEFDELHVWMLHFFVNPDEWLIAHGKRADALWPELPVGRDVTVGRDIINVALHPAGVEWAETITRVVAELEREELIDTFALDTMTRRVGVYRRGSFGKYTRPSGRRFLAFLGEEDSIGAEPPAL